MVLAICGGIVVALGLWLWWQARGPLAGKPGIVPVAVLTGPTQVEPGKTERYSVVVRDVVTGAVVPNQQVRLQWLPARNAPPIGAVRTNDAGEAVFDPTVPQEGKRFTLLATLPGHSDAAAARLEVRTESTADTFISTDKPLYQPGQTVHLRALSMDGSQRPLANREVVLEISDPQNTKVFKEVQKSSAFGIVKGGTFGWRSRCASAATASARAWGSARRSEPSRSSAIRCPSSRSSSTWIPSTSNRRHRSGGGFQLAGRSANR